MEFWISESEKIERRKKWKQDFQSIGQDVYSFFIDTAIEKGFENREGQWDMSFEIVDAMKNQQHILVEAGVGIGKTFAYIVPLATVYKGNIIKNLIMDCQSYTKYRPNETTGGIFVSWRRKEELPTGA